MIEIKEDIIIEDSDSTTKTIATYIFIIFAIVLLFIFGYYIYNNFLMKDDTTLSFDGLINPDFNKIFIDINKNKQDEKIEYEEIKTPDCNYQGKVLKHGQQIVMYSREFVDSYDSCEYYKTVRICSAGLLAGEERFRYFKCSKMLDCVTADNGIVKNGDYIELYSKMSVPFGSKCEHYKGQVRCADGNLVGDTIFKFKNCTVSLDGTCKIDNEILANNNSHIFYKKKIVGVDDNCSDVSLRRYCHDGHLQGNKEYKYWNCVKNNPKNCYLNGITVSHNQSHVFYSKSRATDGKTCDFFADNRKCYDGILSGLEEYSYTTCQ